LPESVLDFYLTDMLNKRMDKLSATFSALADPTRRAILGRLAKGESTVGELARPFDISAPAISRHLRVLEGAGLIERHADAQWRVCRLRSPALREAFDWLARYRQFWEESLDRLAAHLESPSPPRRTKR
jgi:DNA-binding transcriptional ArsR family regulator